MSHVVEITAENYEQEIRQSEIPVLVEFWAPWCRPCRVVRLTLESIAEERTGSVKIASINVDKQQALAIQFRITNIPTFMVFLNGELVERISGAMPRGSFDALIDRNLNPPVHAFVA
jgi:thioredoxin 1